jgi:N-methylhydantoinase A
VSLRATISGVMSKPAMEKIRRGTQRPPSVAERGHRPVYFAERGEMLATPTYARDDLLAGNRMDGPVLVEEYASTTVALPGDRLEVDDLGNLVVEVGGGSS